MGVGRARESTTIAQGQRLSVAPRGVQSLQGAHQREQAAFQRATRDGSTLSFVDPTPRNPDALDDANEGRTCAIEATGTLVAFVVKRGMLVQQATGFAIALDDALDSVASARDANATLRGALDAANDDIGELLDDDALAMDALGGRGDGRAARRR